MLYFVHELVIVLQSDRYQGRNNLANELNLQETEMFTSKPLLLEVVQRLLQGGNTTATKQHPSNPSTSDPQVQEARS